MKRSKKSFLSGWKTHISGGVVVAFGWLCAQAAPPPAGGASSPVSVKLFLDRNQASPGETVEAALEFTPEPGWHTYWKNPGDIGFAPKLEWSSSEDIQFGPPIFEVPERVGSTGKFTNFGYSRSSIVATHFRVPSELKEGSEVQIHVRAKWLVCKDVCVPVRAELDAKLLVSAQPLAVATNAVVQKKFERSRGSRPEAWPAGWELSVSPETSSSGSALVLTLVSSGKTPFPEVRKPVEFFPHQKGLIKTSVVPSLLPLGKDRNPARFLQFRVAQDEGFSAGAREITGLLRLGSRSFEPEERTDLSSIGTQGSERVRTEPPFEDFLSALPAAFVGGLLLNLMPCVFPVLWLKVLAVVAHGRQSRRRRISSSLGYTVGVLATFLTVAGILIALRSAGQALGWGFQLQSPAFVAGMAALFFLIALNLFGVFEFGAVFSGKLAGILGRRGGVGPDDGSFLGSFGTGILAVVVATPCTAPFMGSALGLALTSPPLLALSVFAALGLGLASPFLLLALAPGVGRILPRPGAWMETFKQLLAFPMLATVVWLLWVIGIQRSSAGVHLALIMLLILGLAAWWLGRLQKKQSASVRLPILLILLSIGLGLVRIHALERPHFSSALLSSEWESWSPEVEADLRKTSPLFIDFTAAWCVTCQVNERIALQRKEVMNAFQAKGVRLLKADWTDEDPRITRALAAYGRTGVPLYVLIPEGGSPVLLPQMLSPSTVLEHLSRLPNRE